MKRSDSITNLAKALCEVQKELKPASKNSKGYNYEYTDLAETISTISPVLTKNNLSFTQAPTEFIDGKVGVETLLMHTSGEWIESVMTLPVTKVTPQEVGAAITYAKRYALTAMAGLANEDNDGKTIDNSQQEDPKQDTTPPVKNYGGGTSKITEPQLNKLLKPYMRKALLDGKPAGNSSGVIETGLRKKYNLKKIEEMTSNQLNEFKSAVDNNIPMNIFLPLEFLKNKEDDRFPPITDDDIPF